MSRFVEKSAGVEAITFKELVEYGRANGGNIVDGMPWSFTYNGHPITHENNGCYLIGPQGIRFTPEDMLLSWEEGQLCVMPIAAFRAQYQEYPLPTMDDELAWILGRPNFTVIGIVEGLRRKGHDIKRRSEDEQAAAIYWMLGLYLQYGAKWRDVAKKHLAVAEEVQG